VWHVQEELDEAKEQTRVAEKESADLRMQFRSLETSFDTLLRENESLQAGRASGTSKKTD
jgi:hypothetical protein